MKIATSIILPYLETVSVVLAHKLTGLHAKTPRVERPARGGLAACQQWLIVQYMKTDLAQQIPIAMLAELARLSPFHFCRAFSQLFGVPPHRYHANRRIERARVMLAGSALPVTEIGMELGFDDASLFTMRSEKRCNDTNKISTNHYLKSFEQPIWFGRSQYVFKVLKSDSAVGRAFNQMELQNDQSF